MRALATIVAALLVASCGGGGAPRPSASLPPAATLLVRGTQAFACKDASGPGGGLLLEKDYIGEAKVLQILGPNDLAVRTNIPLNILVHSTSDTKFTPSTAKSFADLGVNDQSVLVLTVCWKQFDPERAIGAFKGFYTVVEASKE